jgi:hypothetical protein
VFFMFHVKFVHYMLKKRQLAKRPLMCPRLFLKIHVIHTVYTFFDWNCAKTHSKYPVKQSDFIVFFPIVIIGYLFLWKTLKTFDMV